ncbi:MAG: DUF1501 domain-containing protein [Planctomycetia bacterium]|nr:DUF1501 domain-containing protein [Planctomycetia bacterium]
MIDFTIGQQFGGGISRRDVLQLAAATGLSFLLPGLQGRAADTRGNERPKSLITLWMGGGPSQLETFDPHPGTEIGGKTKAINTKLPGVQVSDFLPNMAEQIHQMCVIRSMVSQEGDHERGAYLIKTGYRPETTLIHPSIGAIVAHELPAPGVEIPHHISILNSQWPGRGGYLGDDYDPFKVLDPKQNLQNMKATVQDEKRQGQRLRDLAVVEKSFRNRRRIQADATLHQDTVQRALTMMSSQQLKAFQVELEPAAARAAYGDTPFGTGCLIARRLVETGVRSIEVNLDGFDTHANNHDGQKTQADIFDPAFAALIRDLIDRDLFDSTVVLWIGEFGRKPFINNLSGRDHWPSGFSCVVGGGGIRRGLVVGETDPTGQKTNPTDPIEVHDLFATIMKTLGVDYRKEVTTPIGRPMALCKGRPIDRLLA